VVALSRNLCEHRYKRYKPHGLDGLRGVWLALLILQMVITPQLTTKKSKIRTIDHALTTIANLHIFGG
jgi:hypothetical protein